MMKNPITFLGDLFRMLPDRARTAIYAAYLAVGAACALAHWAGVTGVGPVDISQVDTVLLALAPVFGATALSNVSRRTTATRRAAPASDGQVFTAQLGTTQLSNTEVKRIARAVAVELNAAAANARRR